MEIHENNNVLVDLSSLNALLDGNKEGIMQVLTLFIEHTPPGIVEMKKMLADKQWTGLKGKVHSIKAYYGYVGNDALNEKLNAWEIALIETPENYNHAEIMTEIESKTAIIIEKLKEILQAGI